jgi:hypothetical protein
MKNYLLLFVCILYVTNANAQDEQFLGKWNVNEMTADGQTFSLEQLKEFGMATDYLELLPDDIMKMSDKDDILNGKWEFYKDDNILKITIIPSEESKANGIGESSAKYTVVLIEEANMTLKLGKIMTTKYKRE